MKCVRLEPATHSGPGVHSRSPSLAMSTDTQQWPGGPAPKHKASGHTGAIAVKIPHACQSAARDPGPAAHQCGHLPVATAGRTDAGGEVRPVAAGNSVPAMAACDLCLFAQ